MVASSLVAAENRLGTRSNLSNQRPAKEDRYVRVGKIRTRYHTAGESGPALILIHGIGASLESWHLNMEALGQHYRVFAPDVVWFGKSDKPAHEVTGDFFAEFITGFMDAVGILRGTLVGNSMGGMIAVKTALEYAPRVTGLVLVSAAGFGQELAWWLRLHTLTGPGKYFASSVRAARYASRLLVHNPSILTDEFLQTTLEMAGQPGSAEAYTRVLRFGVDWRGVKPSALREIRDAAHAIRVPTLIVWGQQDRVVPVAHAEIAQRCIRHAQVHIFDRCGHAPMLEKADEFNALVTEFMKGNIVQ